MVRVTDMMKGGVGLLLSFIIVQVQAQCLQFAPTGNPPAVRLNGKILASPWAGGINACHFAAIDLDGDGKDDYIAFDRVGSRIQCFSSDWEHLPGLEYSLPVLLSWVQTHDYDRDGRQDIFTFNGISGIRVYRNESVRTADGYKLAFRMVSDGLQAEMFGMPTPIYCTNTDYPVVADIDGDGDLDVLNFWVPSSGDFLLYYRNFAFEELGRTDTFCLKIEDWSWGCFVESEESNLIFLDSCSSRNQVRLGEVFSPADSISVIDPFSASAESSVFSSPDSRFSPDAAFASRPVPKHAGSTLFAFKNTETELYDIVVGDVGYPGLFYLHNGGTPQNARIIRYDTVFPLTAPVRLYNFPVLSEIRYRDSLCYVFSPFDTDPFTAEGRESMWRYAETGRGVAQSALVQKDFLQNAMLDFGVGAVAVVFDYNRDGRPDLVVGNYGNKTDAWFEGGSWNTRMEASLSLLENTGTAEEPAFEWKTDDYLGLSSFGLRALYPAFADLDGDGRDELVLGMEDGRLWLFRIEDGNPQRAVLLDSAFLDVRFSGFSAPVLFDLNGDGLQDLIVGEKQHSWPTTPRRTTKGSLTYFENTGVRASGFPVFVKRTDSLGGVDVIDRDFSNFGYSRPSFFRHAEGKIYLACGSENGEIFLYDEIAGNTDGIFRFMGQAAIRQEDESLRKIRVGLHAAPLLYDWNGDGIPELIAGNQCGGLQYFDGRSIAPADDLSVEKDAGRRPGLCRLYPNPVSDGFYVELPSEGTATLSDMRGAVLQHRVLPAGLHYFDMQGLTPGLYIWHYRGLSGSESLKVVKYE